RFCRSAVVPAPNRSMRFRLRRRPLCRWPYPDGSCCRGCPDPAGLVRVAAARVEVVRSPTLLMNVRGGQIPLHTGGFPVLTKVSPPPLRPGKQAEAGPVVLEFAPQGPGQEDGPLPFRVYSAPARPDSLLFVEHFADQAASDPHPTPPAYKQLIAGRF